MAVDGAGELSSALLRAAEQGRTADVQQLLQAGAAADAVILQA
jgi:hypothetical protein